MSRARAPATLPAMTIGELRAALHHGAAVWARAQGRDPRSVSAELIENQVVAVLHAGAAAAPPPVARTRLYRDPTDGTVRTIEAPPA